jgi:hypothetical protein
MNSIASHFLIAENFEHKILRTQKSHLRVPSTDRLISSGVSEMLKTEKLENVYFY